ncbi:MAG TPA: hypothetical protein VG939_08135 [Caulobacteraceae bacterium]|nr:hypothetical protein [Caulobacteraceae bacterium]
MLWVAMLAVPALATAPIDRTGPVAGAPAAADQRHAVDPQSGQAWSDGLTALLDKASGVSWSRKDARLQIGYQQRDFAPAPPGVDVRGYDTLLKDAPDMVGLSFKLHPHR